MCKLDEFIFGALIDKNKVRSLAPIATVMPFAQRLEALAKWHLSGKRGAHF